MFVEHNTTEETNMAIKTFQTDIFKKKNIFLKKDTFKKTFVKAMFCVTSPYVLISLLEGSFHSAGINTVTLIETRYCKLCLISTLQSLRKGCKLNEINAGKLFFFFVCVFITFFCVVNK
jgi:hypothetical protein